MQDGARVDVAVRPAEALRARPQLIAALERAFPVRFVAWEDGPTAAAALLQVAPDPATEAAPAGVRTLVVADATAGWAPFEEIALAEDAAVDRRVRGVTLRDRLAGSPLAGDGAVLAARGRDAIWSRAQNDAAAVDRVRCALPELEPGQVLYALLSQRAIAMVALMHLLREITAPVAWQPPPLRAAFVFDDPNLRWRRYGHIDYRQLAAHADEHGYHAAMAMIPLDAGWPHRPTVGLFRERADRLSLVFHGNDHLRHELLLPQDDASALAMAAQSIRRVERFERRTGLPVQRIMMPPHGRCSEAMARALAAVGFEALSAIHPAPWTEERPVDPPLVAWSPAEFVGGCAVIPRDVITSTQADLALRAFLNHALIVYGHHDDVAGGLEPLAEAAARISRLGDVRWTSVGDIARGNHVHRVDGGRVVVRPYSRRVDVAVPAGADAMVVEAPEPIGGRLELRGWSLDDGPVVPFGTAQPVAPGTAPVRLHGARDVDPATVPAPAWRPWPRLRRAGTELRDRAVALGRA